MTRSSAAGTSGCSERGGGGVRLRISAMTSGTDAPLNGS